MLMQFSIFRVFTQMHRMDFGILPPYLYDPSQVLPITPSLYPFAERQLSLPRKLDRHKK